MHATPLVWNNIAYQLSLKKTHLDRAQQYAESAVSATAAALRNLSLDRLTQKDLPLVSIPDRLLGYVGLGALWRKAISTRLKSMWPPPGISDIMAKSATTSARFMKSAARKIAPCAPMRCL